MGAEFQVESLEEMCDLMCNNKVPAPKSEPLSIEETIRQLKKCKSFHNGSYGEALNIAIKVLEQTKWISVSERMPEEHKDVLTCSLGGFIEIQSFENVYDGYWENQNGAWFDLDEVAAWMPLPEPYKAESEETDADSN